MIGITLLLQTAVVPTTSTPPIQPAADCVVIPQDKDALTKTIFVTCGRRAVWLGIAQDYRSSYNPTMKCLLVVSTWQGTQRVRVISIQPDGSLQVDDFTRNLAKLAGRFPDFGLTANVDISMFASDGTVSVQSIAAPKDVSPVTSSVAIATPAAQPIVQRLDLRAYLGGRN